MVLKTTSEENALGIKGKSQWKTWSLQHHSSYYKSEQEIKSTNGTLTRTCIHDRKQNKRDVQTKTYDIFVI